MSNIDDNPPVENRAGNTSRVQQRMNRPGAPPTLTGIGSGLAANQQVSLGVDPEEAEAIAAEARGGAAQAFSGGEDNTQTAGEEIPPPDMEKATDEEMERAHEIVRLLRTLPEDQQEEMDMRVQETQLRRHLETELEPLQLDQMMFSGQVQQRVPLFGGEAYTIFQSLKGTHLAALRRWSGKFLAQNLKLPRDLASRTSGITTTACGVVAIGSGTQIEEIPGKWPQDVSPYCSEADFKVYHDFFLSRLEWILDKALPMQRLLSVQYTWFDQRVAKCFNDSAYVVQEAKKS